MSDTSKAKSNSPDPGRLYRSIFEIAPTSIIVEDARGTILDVNPAFTRIFGYRPEEAVGKNISFLAVSDPPEKVTANIGRILGGQSLRHIVRNRRRSGEISWLDLNETAIPLPGGGQGVLVIANDITPQVEADQAARSSESRLNAILTSMADLVFAFDSEGRFIFHSIPPGTGLYKPPTDFLEKKHAEVMPAEVDSQFRKAFEKSRRGEISVYDYRLGEPETPRWFSCKLSPIMLSGAFAGAVGVVSDITERKLNEEALLRHSLVYRSMDEGVLVFDRQSRCIDLNPAGERITGWQKEELLGKPAEILNPPGEAAGVTARIREGLAVNGTWEGEIPLLTKKGELRTMFTVVSCLRDQAGNWIGNIGINRDITAAKKIEAELVRAQKLESLGALAGGIAHDFNNLLMSILANASLARTQPRKDQDELIEEIEKACSQAQNLTRQLLTFSRGGAPVKRPVALDGILREAAGMALRGSSSFCRFHLARELQPVEADPGQLFQAFSNLLLNSAQAMPGGGEILIAAANEELKPENSFGLPPGDYIRTEIADQGGGIPPQYLARIFDPFFTTRKEGTGLGIPITYSIVRNHGGCLDIRSEPGRGCTAVILLPSSRTAVPEEEPPATGLVRGRGRILVCDDEPAVRKITCRMLESLGYRAEGVRDGNLGIERYLREEAGSDPFRAVIFDLTFPGGMGGREALEKLRAASPGIRAIVASGYSEDPVLADPTAYGFRGSLAKPYGIEKLARELDRVLRAP